MLGEIIEKTRRFKHVTIIELTQAAGISQATYHRMRHDRADIKLTAWLALLDKLRLQVADIAPGLTANFLDCQRWQEKVTRQLLAVVRHEADEATLAELQAALPDAIATHAGLAPLQLYLDLMQAKLGDDQARARQLAQTLFVRLQHRRGWTSWEHQLCVPTVQYLSWAQLQVLYHEHLAGRGSAWVKDEYLALLASVLAAKNGQAALTVLGWWQTQFSADLAFAPFLRFATILTARLTCQPYAQAWTQLQAQMMRLWGGQPNAPLAIMQRLWRLTPGITAQPLPSEDADTPQRAAFEPASIAAGIGELRHAKRLPVDRLWQELFISKAAYYRQFGADASLKTNEFFAALDSLQVQSADLRAINAHWGLGACATQVAIAADLTALDAGRQPTQSVAVWRMRLQERLATTGNCAYRQLQTWLDVELAKRRHDRLTAMKAALKLYRELVGYDGWSAFEYSLVIAVLPFLPFNQGQFLFSRYLDTAETTHLALRCDHERDELYLGLLASALAEGDVTHVRLALRWIKNRHVAPEVVDFRIWQRVAELLLTGHDPAAFAALQAAVHAVFGTAASALQDRLRAVWQATVAIEDNVSVSM